MSRDDKGWDIGPECRKAIDNLLDKGDRILELGSGPGTAKLAKRYRVTSVEHDAKWLDRYDSTYIHAPIFGSWYDPGRLANLPPYDLLLVDGPPGAIGRLGLLEHLRLFDLSAHIIVDDVQRDAEKELLAGLETVTGRKGMVYDDYFGKQFAVIGAAPIVEEVKMKVTPENKMMPTAENKAADGVSSPLDITPAAQELIDKHDLDASTIKGTGAGGRILVSDVREAMGE